MRQLYRFPGGVHPPQAKDASASLPPALPPLPPLLTVPLAQHIGTPAAPVVAAGERVLKGQLIGAPEGHVSCGVHAPASGRVTGIEMRPVPHPSGLEDLCVLIEPDGEERWIERAALDWRAIEPRRLLDLLQQMGIAGLGGAVFPTFIKLDPEPRHRVRTLIVNGAECEPYITCDDTAMRHHALEVMQGVEIIRHLLGVREVLIGIEDNKTEAIAAMRAAAGAAAEVVAVPTVYPAGGERQLIYTLTGREVPSGQRPHHVGVACFNVGTARAVHRAVNRGEPLVSRIVTVTGNVAGPRNWETLFGTPVSHLVQCAGPQPDTDAVIMGGPMMGFRLPNDRVPVVKATNCVIAASKALFPLPPPARPCIRCSRCADACPARLQPMDLYNFARSRNFGKAQEYALFDCIECGCCSYVCPSHIPLVQFYRYAKAEIWAREKEKKASDLARSRHQFRQERLERDRQERAERLAKKTGADAPAAQPAPDAQTEVPDLGSATEVEARRARMREIARSPAHTEEHQ